MTKSNNIPDTFRYFSEPAKVTEKCIFCKIADGRIKPGGKHNPQELVYEDEHYVAFDDMSPGAKSHTLVIPKKHLKNCWDLTPSMMDDMEEIGNKILKDRNPEGKPTKMFFIRPPLNTVFHVHLHVMVLPFTESILNPRRLGFEYSLFHVTPTEVRKYFR